MSPSIPPVAGPAGQSSFEQSHPGQSSFEQSSPGQSSSGQSSLQQPRLEKTRRRPRSALLAPAVQRLAYAVAAAAFLWLLTAWALQW